MELKETVTENRQHREQTHPSKTNDHQHATVAKANFQHSGKRATHVEKQTIIHEFADQKVETLDEVEITQHSRRRNRTLKRRRIGGL